MISDEALDENDEPSSQDEIVHQWSNDDASLPEGSPGEAVRSPPSTMSTLVGTTPAYTWRPLQDNAREPGTSGLERIWPRKLTAAEVK